MHYRIFSHNSGVYRLDGSSTSYVTPDIANGLLGAEFLLVEDYFSNPSFPLLLAFLLVCRSLSADKLQGFPKLGKRHLEYFPREKCGMTVMGWITILLHSLDHSETEEKLIKTFRPNAHRFLKRSVGGEVETLDSVLALLSQG